MREKISIKKDLIKQTKMLSKIELDEFIDIYSEIHGGLDVVEETIQSGRGKTHREFVGKCGNHNIGFRIKTQNVDKTTFLCKKCKEGHFANYKIERMEKEIEKLENISIVSIEVKGTSVRFNLKCLKHNKDFSINGGSQFHQYSRGERILGCSKCANEHAVKSKYKNMHKNKNTIYLKRPDMMPYLKNKDDALNYTYGSNRLIWFKCPHCGFEKEISPNSFTTRDGFSCNSCGDIRSSGEKIFLNMLLQIPNITFKAEYVISGYLYRYDFYIKDINTIVEIHGRQHYNDTESFGWIPLEDTIANDIAKKEIAIKNNYNYVEIDCRKSNFDFIKNSILKSMDGILDITTVDWSVVFERSAKGNIILVAEYRKIGYRNYEIASILGISKETVSRHASIAKKANLL